MADKTEKLSVRERLWAILRTMKLSYQTAPLMVLLQVAGSVFSAVLPIVTSYFAALTTTALADAYNGIPGAGGKAIEYVIVTAILGILMTTWQSLEQYVNELMRYKVDAAIEDRMYEHFLSLDFWRYDDKETADLHDKARRFAGGFPYIFNRFTGMITAFASMIAGLAALVLVNWWLGLILIAAVIPSIYVQIKLSRAQAAHWDRMIGTRRVGNEIGWLLGRPPVIAELRLYGLVNHLLGLRRQLRDKDQKEQIEYERRFIFKRLGADALQAAAEVVALLFTVMQIIARAQPIGQFIYVQQVVSRALSGAGSFVGTLNSIDQDMANLYDYQKFIGLPGRKDEGRKRLKQVPSEIKLQGVWFRYRTSGDVLKDVSFTINRGQHVAIVGENGAGKTTLIKILTGLYLPSQGEVLLDGENLQNISLESWHRQLGVLSQEPLNYQYATIRENIYLGDIANPTDEKRFELAVADAEAKEFIEKLPKGYDSYINPWMEDDEGTPGAELSGGQWQRLALARNFYRDSPIIILDEPTSAVDALAESRIFKRLLSDKERTVITISHRLTTVEKADVIYMLEDGRVVEKGSHAELVKKRGAYYRMFESQLHHDGEDKSRQLKIPSRS